MQTQPSVKCSAFTRGETLGECFCFGYPAGDIWSGVQELFAVTGVKLDARVVETAGKMVEELTGRFHVLEGSCWHRAMADYVASSQVTVIDRRTACALMLEEKHFVFFDDMELATGVGEELRTVFSELPSGAVTAKHVECARRHWDYFSAMANRLEEEVKRRGKRMRLCMSYSPLHHFVGDLFTLFVGDSVVVTTSIKRAWKELNTWVWSPETYVIGVWNLGGCTTMDRKNLSKFQYWGYDICLLHGDTRGPRDPVPRKPIIEWSPGVTGIMRFHAMAGSLVGFLGLSPLTYDMEVTLAHFEAIGATDEQMRWMYGGVPKSSYAFLHLYQFCEMGRLADVAEGKILVSIRDCRDRIVSRALA